MLRRLANKEVVNYMQAMYRNKYQITQPHDVPVDLLSQTSIRQFEQLNRYFI